MKKSFKCPACKKIMERDVPRNVIVWRSFCEHTSKDVLLKRIKSVVT